MSFSRYPKYKDSGVEWLGEEPEHWRIARLRRLISEPLTNGIFKRKEEFGDGVPLVNVSDIYQEDFIIKIDTLERVMCDPKEIATYTILPGDLFFVRSSLKQEGIAAVALVEDFKGQAVFECHLIRARVNMSLLHAKYANYVLNSHVYRAKTISLAKVTTMTTLDQEAILSMMLPLPSMLEQERIAMFLDHEIAKIDSLIEEQQRLIELLKEKRQAVISQAVTKGLNSNVPMKDSGVEWLGQIPAHWKMRRLKNISPSITVGIVVNPSNYVEDSGLPFIYGGDIREGLINWQEARCISEVNSKKNAKTMLRFRDLLMVRVGAPGVTAVVPPECEGGNCASVLHIARGEYDSNWLCFLANSSVVSYQVRVVQYGAAQEQFNVAHAVDFWIPTPPLREQEEIAQALDQEISKIDILMREAQYSVNLLQERRTALISAAVTGKIDVRNYGKKGAA